MGYMRALIGFELPYVGREFSSWSGDCYSTRCRDWYLSGA